MVKTASLFTIHSSPSPSNLHPPQCTFCPSIYHCSELKRGLITAIVSTSRPSRFLFHFLRPCTLPDSKDEVLWTIPIPSFIPPRRIGRMILELLRVVPLCPKPLVWARLLKRWVVIVACASPCWKVDKLLAPCMFEAAYFMRSKNDCGGPKSTSLRLRSGLKEIQSAKVFHHPRT